MVSDAGGNGDVALVVAAAHSAAATDDDASHDNWAAEGAAAAVACDVAVMYIDGVAVVWTWPHRVVAACATADFPVASVNYFPYELLNLLWISGDHLP